jgi:ABC-2 type transport system ATP-binding protein
MLALRTRGLSKTFKVKRKEPGLGGSLRSLFRPQWETKPAVRGIDLDVEQGETVAFLGPNGAGKSTTIKMLTGILHPSSGEAEVLGLSPWRQRAELAYRIGAVFGQKSQLWYHLPPVDTFELIGRVYEMRRDEYARRSRELIRERNRSEETTVFLTSHDAGDVEELCSRVVVIHHGGLLLDEPVERMKRDVLNRKTINVTLADPVSDAALALPDGARVVRAEGRTLTVAVDLRRTAIEQVLATWIGRVRLEDITVEDPPLEETIKHIYGMRQETEAGA